MAYDLVICISDPHFPYNHPDIIAFLKAIKDKYWANPNGLFWGMQIGCLIDDDSLAFSYNNVNLKRPIIGTGIILNGQPKLIPMKLNSKGRWIRELR